MLERHRFLAASAVLIFCAALFHVGTIGGGLLLDDIAIYGGLSLARDGVPGANWWDPYFLGGYDERLRFSGALPWWVAEGVQLHFFRRLAAATHYLDVLAWPHSTALMHVHNLAWFGLTGVAVAWLYRSALASRTEALLALAVFMFSYVHEWPVQWLAARNSMMALCFGAISVVGFRRWSEGWRWPALAGIGLVLSLLSSELGVSVLALVISGELGRRGDAGEGRWSRLGLAAGTVAVWRVAYVAGGYGAIGAGTYIDPLSAPMAFLAVGPERLAIQALGLLGPPELLLQAAVSLVWRIILWIVAGVSAAAVLRRVRESDVWPWAIGAALALIPLISSVPQARLLGFAMLAMAPIFARALVRAWSGGLAGRLLAAVVGLQAFVVGPLLITGALDRIRPSEIAAFGEPGTNLGDVGGRNLLLINPPSFASAKMVAAVRDTKGLPMPAFAWALGVGEDVQITREGCCTLVLRSPEGFFRERWSAMYRGPQVPFTAGDVVNTLAFEAQVRAVTERGFASEVAFVMSGPLRSPQFVFARWNGRDFEVVQPREIPREAK